MYSIGVNILILALITLLSACSEQEERDSRTNGASMKCGAGKCGANMFEGNLALVKKKKNILSQMDVSDLRTRCVIDAQTTKLLYDCLRDRSTGRLSISDPSAIEEPRKEPIQKSGAEKCGGEM